MCVQSVSGERDGLLAAEKRMCSTCSILLSVTRVGCRVMFSVLEGNVQQYQRKISNFEVL